MPAWGPAATLGQSENLRKRRNPQKDGQHLRENRKKKTVEENARAEAVNCVRPAYALRTIPYFPRMPCIRSPLLPQPEYLSKRGATRMVGLTETSLLPSLWVDRVRSFHKRFCERVSGRVVSRLAPDRRPAPWCPVALSILGWRSLKDTQVGPTCTVRPSGEA